MSGGIGLGVVGNELQGWASLYDKWNMQEAFKKAQETQGKFADKAMANFNTRLGVADVDTARKQMAQGASDRVSGYNAASQVPMTLQSSALPESWQNRDKAYAQMIGGTGANLASYGDWLQQQWLANQDYNRQFADIQQKASGAASLLPTEMYNAQHSMDMLSNIGGFLSNLLSNQQFTYNQNPFGGGNSYAGGGGTSSNVALQQQLMPGAA